MSAESPRPAHVTAHLVPHTHWDREWYLPFESFRARLVDVVGQVLDLLDDPAARFPSFTLDGQAIVLDDVLEVRPDWRERVERQVRAGRLRIGPWYVLADEYLVSPEALVRNLDLGLRTCARFGGAMSVAYTPDSFGHVAQLPTIVRGFGLEAVVFERGVGDEGEHLGCEFTWRSPAGEDEVFASHLIGTYSAATALGHEDWEYQDAFDPERAVSQLRAALFGPTEGRPDFPTWLRTALERLQGGIVPYVRSGHVLLLNGSDHLFPQRNLADVIDVARGRLDGVQLTWNDVEGYVTATRAALEAAGTVLPVHQGEFRSSRYHHVLSGTWSARLPLKRMNHRAETLLERYAAPLQALAAVHGRTANHAGTDHAWRTLLANHPHDSICGCSVDEVHRAMVPRFEAATRVAEELCARAVQHVTRGVRGPSYAVFQPHPVAGHAVVQVPLELPEGTARRLQVVDGRGRVLPVQVETDRVPTPGRSDGYVDVGRAWILADLPGTSVSLLRWSLDGSLDDEASRTRPSDAAAAPHPVRVTRLAGDASGEHAVRLANHLLAVTVGPHGRVTLEDVASGTTRSLRFGLEDQADRGDSYDHSEVPGREPRFAFTPIAPADIVADGPLHAAVRWTLDLPLPGRLGDDRVTPVGSAAATATVTVSLDANAPSVGVDVDLEVDALDHRLRAWIETDVVTDHLVSEGHWHLLERPIDPPAADGWYQRPVSTHHARRFTAVTSDDAGVAVLLDGHPEVEPIRTSGGTAVAVTLVRAVGWLSRDDLISRPQGAGPPVPATEAQCTGRHDIRLGLVPFGGRRDLARVVAAADRFTAPPRAFAAGPVDPRPDLAPAERDERGRVETDAPSTIAGIRLDPRWALSTITPARGPSGPVAPDALDATAVGATAVGAGRAASTVLVRFWNPLPEPTTGALDLPDVPLDCQRVRLDETPLHAVPHDGRRITLDLGPSEVVTLAVTLPHVPHPPRG